MRVLFIYKQNRSFVKKDIEILQKFCSVDTIKFSIKKLPDIKKKIRNDADFVYCWFASYHSYYPIKWAKKYGKFSIVVVGGYDASNIKGYGIFSNKKGRFIANSIYKNVDLILPVDESLKEDILKHSQLNIEDKFITLPTGYDHKRFFPKGSKKNIVLTVGFVNEINWWRKGLITFIEVAKKMPDVQFIVAGNIDKKVQKKIDETPNNITFTGWIEDEELLRLYQQAKVYCQLSNYEGLPNVLCEAMLCECIPIGSRANGIPRAIGDTGFYAPYGDVDLTYDAVRKALSSNMELGKKARNRIIELFPSELRKKRLKEILEMIK